MQPISDELLGEIPAPDWTKYSTLGFIANPFTVPDDADEDPAVASECSAAGNLLLKAVAERSAEDAPRPLVVLKAELPSQYPLRALSSVEPYLAADEDLGVLYAYVPLFGMRIGATRATLGVIAERLAFRDFAQTLSAYVASVLTAPDAELVSFGNLPVGSLDEFGERFAVDSVSAVADVFGSGGLELHPELAQVADLRQSSLNDEDTEADVAQEVDATVGDAPGSAIVEAQAVQNREEADLALFEYFIEYTSAHLSPVIARALRLYRSRGEAAFASELRVTKAPRKTLAAVLRLARFRFRNVAFIYDGFESWLDVPDDMRSKLMGSLSEMRWKAAGLAFPIFLLTPGEAPEVEETFGGSGAVAWDFPGLVPMQDAFGDLLPEVVSFWLEAATLDGHESAGLSDRVLSRLAEASNGSMQRFVRMAHAAVESAAERACSSLDDDALEAGLEAGRL